MNIRIESLKEESTSEIPLPCKQCIYWEAPDEFEKLRTAEHDKVSEMATKKKQEWFAKTLKTFGSCGKIVYADETVIGYAQYAPQDLLPQVGSYQSKNIGNAQDGTVFLSCLYIKDEGHRGKGIGKSLLENIIAELKPRGFKALETFARKDSSNNPSGPLEFYLKNGFLVKDTINLEYMLVRLEF